MLFPLLTNHCHLYPDDQHRPDSRREPPDARTGGGDAQLLHERDSKGGNRVLGYFSIKLPATLQRLDKDALPSPPSSCVL